MNPFPRGRVAFFVTSNVQKFNEARRVLAEYRVATALLRIKALEIQDNNIESIAKASAIDAVEKCSLPIIVEDAGLFIEALNGFPGPYSSYVHRTIGNRGVLQLMENVEKRDAYFHSVVAFCSPQEPPKCFHGKVRGKISQKERGNLGFGFDPIFKPSGGRGKTFAEMTTTQKNRYSHRARALRRFARWYTSSP
ncbi:MAG: XTP/dITP diphosphatase [Candidatus Bathyarchaeia archaeon]